MKKDFKTAKDFRKSLETKLKNLAVKKNLDLQRLRRKVSFDRFLARVFSTPNSFCLKGGYAMELTFATARATKDIDLVCLDPWKNQETQEVYNELTRLSEIELGDYFHFQLKPAQIELANTLYGGARFPISSFVDGRLFVNFKIDVAIDLLPPKMRTLKGDDWLHFIEIPPPLFSMISLEQQFAEKIHAYTFPRDNENSRVKDLVDLMIILKEKAISIPETREMLDFVFQMRKSHPLPDSLPKPLDTWEEIFRKLAIECGIKEDLYSSHRIIAEQYGTILTLPISH